MHVFLSWSGTRSKHVAASLKTFLKGIIQRTEPWMSAEDLQVGQRWFSEVAGHLEECGVGVLCLTRDNLESTWLHFEAGALSKKIDKSLVCPYLLDLEPTDVTGPLAGFQGVPATEEGTKKLVRTINGALGESKLDEGTLAEAFQLWWPRLEDRLRNAPAQPAGREGSPEVRRDRDLLEEILLLVRRLTTDQKRFDRERLRPLLGKYAAREGPTHEADLLRVLQEIRSADLSPNARRNLRSYFEGVPPDTLAELLERLGELDSTARAAVLGNIAGFSEKNKAIASAVRRDDDEKE